MGQTKSAPKADPGAGGGAAAAPKPSKAKAKTRKPSSYGVYVKAQVDAAAVRAAFEGTDPEEMPVDLPQDGKVEVLLAVPVKGADQKALQGAVRKHAETRAEGVKYHMARHLGALSVETRTVSKVNLS